MTPVARSPTLPVLARAAVAALLAAASAPASACSVCGCGDPLLSAGDPAAITGQLRLQLDTEYLRVDAGTEGRPGSTDRLTQSSYRLNAVYRPMGALSLSATVPLVSKQLRTVGGGADVLASSRSGLGDVEVGARYSAWTSVNFGRRRVQELAVSAGTAIPTGEHDARNGDGTLLDPHGQLGTGGWGPFAGVHYRLEQGEWTGFASLSYRARTEASYFDGSRYRFGDALLWSVHGQYLVRSRVALDLGIDGRRALADRAAAPGAGAAAVENTGGTVLSLAPGVYVNAVGRFWLFVRAQLPFRERLRGEQDVRPTFVGGLQLQVL